MFKKFLIKYNKTYLDEKEYLNHLKIFNKSLNIINNHNKNHLFNLSINKFSDLTEEEMKKYKSGNLFEKLKRDNLRTLYVCDGDDDINDEDIELPKRLDYREKGALNPIISQGSCGSCSAFSVVSIIEAYYFLKKDKLYKFSEQQIVDCLSEKTKENYCDGSLRSDILEYVKDYGLMLFSEYPYISGQSSIPHKCKYNEDKIVTKIDNF